MKVILLMTLLAFIGCSSNKSAKQEFNETADQVDSGVRKAIKEVKNTTSKAFEKLQTDD